MNSGLGCPEMSGVYRCFWHDLMSETLKCLAILSPIHISLYDILCIYNHPYIGIYRLWFPPCCSICRNLAFSLRVTIEFQQKDCRGPMQSIINLITYLCSNKNPTPGGGAKMLILRCSGQKRRPGLKATTVLEGARNLVDSRRNGMLALDLSYVWTRKGWANWDAPWCWDVLIHVWMYMCIYYIVCVQSSWTR